MTCEQQKPSEVLEKALSLIETRERWTQHKYARDECGMSTEPTNPEACARCWTGAVYAAADITIHDSYHEENRERLFPIWNWMRRAVDLPLEDSIYSPDTDLFQWNDRHTHTEVIAATRKAIALAEAAGE